jgi:hypothetical protein
MTTVITNSSSIREQPNSPGPTTDKTIASANQEASKPTTNGVTLFWGDTDCEGAGLVELNPADEPVEAALVEESEVSEGGAAAMESNGASRGWDGPAAP